LGHPRLVGRSIDLGACENQSALGIDEFEARSQIKIGPNPYSVSTIVQSDKILNNVTLTLYDAHGNQVKRIINITGKVLILQRDGLPSGIYFLNLTSEGGNIFKTKLLIEDN
jgi:hypothetical protein